MSQSYLEKVKADFQERGQKFLSHEDAEGLVADNSLLILVDDELYQFFWIHLIFPKDETHFFTARAAGFKNCRFCDDLYHSGLALCMELNEKYRWLKFFLDNDYDLVVQYDSWIDEHSCLDVVTNGIVAINIILQDAYPRVMQVRRGVAEQGTNID